MIKLCVILSIVILIEAKSVDVETLTPRTYERNKRMEGKATQDAVTGYYDFLVNEGSFKFWATFQVVTAAILIYSAFAAVYYAKFNVITADYDDDYDWLRRKREIPAETFQRILDAVSSREYE